MLGCMSSAFMFVYLIQLHVGFFSLSSFKSAAAWVCEASLLAPHTVQDFDPNLAVQCVYIVPYRYILSSVHMCDMSETGLPDFS